MKSIYLISCVSVKLPHKAKAEDLYTSPLFKYNLKYARLHKPDTIYILSAKYGLVPLDEEIDTYNKTLNTMKLAERREWADLVMTQLEQACDIQNTLFTFLAGQRYREFLMPRMPHTAVPFKGKGIGVQLGELKAATASNTGGFGL